MASQTARSALPSVTSGDFQSPLQCSLHDSDATLDVDNAAPEPNGQKKKKKKKPKKSASAKEKVASSNEVGPKTEGSSNDDDGSRPSVLCISRNKHWRYISSYHGPWLQLPVELLESLLTLNIDPNTLDASDYRSAQLPESTSPTNSSFPHKRNGYHHLLSELASSESPSTPSLSSSALTLSSQANLPSLFPTPEAGKPTPPPIDPGVFRNVASIRRLIDEAAELSVRASSGLSAAELNMMRSSPNNMNGFGGFNNPWAGMNSGGGRSVAMSAMRIHRLRALAVQKLAAAYSADEIASSVMVMQGGSVFDDLAERVLKTDPNDCDARYVHFFHEKIPSSRQLAESTTTQVLDELIRMQPHRLEYYRTRGIVHCFRDEFSMATKDFTHALKEAKAIRKTKLHHQHNYSSPVQGGSGKHGKNGKRRKAGGRSKRGGPPEEDPRDDRPDADPDADSQSRTAHPSVLPDAPTPLEPQLLFLRGAAYLQHAVHLIEGTALELEGIRKFASGVGMYSGELRLSCLDGSNFGGIEVGNPDGPLGHSSEPKATAYRAAFGVAGNGEPNGRNGDPEKLRDQILGLVRKSMRDHERFLAHFDSIDAGFGAGSGEDGETWNLAQKVEYAFLLLESIRPGSQTPAPPPPASFADGSSPLSKYSFDMMALAGPNTPGLPPPTTFTTYHPLLVEAHFSILLCLLLLGDFTALLPAFEHTSRVVDGLEGYPVFLPPRSMAQAEFVEVLERLAGGWRTGVENYSVYHASRGKARAKDDGNEQRSVVSLGPPHPDSASSSSSSSPPETRSTTPTEAGSHSHSAALNSARILLSPVVARQRARAEAAMSARKSGASASKKPIGINIPLHGPRVDVILTWMAAVQLPPLDAAAAAKNSDTN